ncbi:MAG: DUF2202 domain-containing protein [Flavobacteriaceae bacterium]|nr:DUF2202 domain-containing protein [Flavobacteriaceae bacterium]
MKPLTTKITTTFFISLLFTLVYGCTTDDNGTIVSTSLTEADKVSAQDLTDSDEEALLFMFEEEKLARDTYDYLDNYWGLNQFANIKKSEQSHMDAVENLLILYGIAYEELPKGEFSDLDLQNFYNQFITDGIVSQVAALTIGATIEDLDIVDLEEHIAATNNTDIINVFTKLQCGSGNHLRAFVSSLNKLGESYAPQFLTETEYEEILNASSGGCQ